MQVYMCLMHLKAHATKPLEDTGIKHALMTAEPATPEGRAQAYYAYLGMTPPPPTKTGVRLITLKMSSTSKKKNSTNPKMELTLVMPRIYLCPTPDLPLDGDFFSVWTV